MKRGFTLIELLVVVGIMGLMGTASVGAYRQMQQGIEESRVVDNASKFIELVAERAQIDRRPTAVFCWNELLREETDDEPEIVVGRAVAIRQRGRISRVQGSWLCDEFGDLEQIDEDGEYMDAPSKKIPSRLYLFDNLQDGVLYSIVHDIPQTRGGKKDDGQIEFYMNAGIINGDNDEKQSGLQKEDGIDGNIIQYGFYIEDRATAGGKWKAGSAYGMEFQSLELPHGYIFGSQKPTSMSKPVVEVATLVFDVEAGSSSGAAVGSSSVAISVLKPGQSGSVSAQRLGSTTPPKTKLN